MGVDVQAAIRRCGKKENILRPSPEYNRLREEPGGFQEIFQVIVGDLAGTIDMFEAMKAYYEIGFEKPIRPDQAPRMEFDNRIAGGVPGHLLLAKVFDMGYLKGLAEV